MAEKDYSATPLWNKLGIRDGSHVAVIGAPAHFRSLLGELPAGVTIARRPTKSPEDVIVLFETHASNLAAAVHTAKVRLTPAGGLWIAYPKKTSAIRSDVTFDDVQRAGLAAGLVDNKICAIDTDWTAMRFVYRRGDRPDAGRRS